MVRTSVGAGPEDDEVVPYPSPSAAPRSVAAVSEPVHPGLYSPSGLIGGGCRGCGRRHFPRAVPCPWCGSDDVESVTLATTGTLWGWTAVTAAPPGYDGPVPYGFGVVELPDDGLRVVTRLADADLDRLVEGMAMRFTVVAIGGDLETWAFTPA